MYNPAVYCKKVYVPAVLIPAVRIAPTSHSKVLIFVKKCFQFQSLGRSTFYIITHVQFCTIWTVDLGVAGQNYSGPELACLQPSLSIYRFLTFQ